MFYSNKTPTHWSSLVIAFKRFGVIKRNSAISVRNITRVKTIQKKKHWIGRHSKRMSLDENLYMNNKELTPEQQMLQVNNVNFLQALRSRLTNFRHVSVGGKYSSEEYYLSIVMVKWDCLIK